MTELEPTVSPQAANMIIAGASLSGLEQRLRWLSRQLERLRGEFVVTDLDVTRNVETSSDVETVLDYVVTAIGFDPRQSDDNEDSDDVAPESITTGSCDYVEAVINGPDHSVPARIADLLAGLPEGATVLDFSISQWMEPGQGVWRVAVYYAADTTE